MYTLRAAHHVEDESELLDVNITNVANELTELVDDYTKTACKLDNSEESSAGARAPWPGVNEMKHFERLRDIEEMRLSFEALFQTKYLKAQQSSLYSMSPLFCKPAKSFGFSYDTNSIPTQTSTGAHYKRRASAADVENLVPLLNAARIEGNRDPLLDDIKRVVGVPTTPTNIRKKYTSRDKLTIDHWNDSKDETVGIGPSQPFGYNVASKKHNEVERLFDLFHKFHYFLNDELPNETGLQATTATPDERPNNFEPRNRLMPSTLNIQTQIKHCIYKCNGYCQKKIEKLDEYRYAERQLYNECSRSIYVLRKLNKQLESFKTAEFEHRNFSFVNSFASAKAKNLELHLTQMIEKIRECNINVEVYQWSIQRNIQETGLPSMETLQKAIAIAGAISESASKDVKESMDKNKVLSTEDKSGGGGAAAFAVIPESEHFQAIRFIGR